MIHKVLDYMVEKSLASLTIYWQGGEAMLLPPSWYRQAEELIQREAEARGKQVFHSLQSNMLAYSSRWNKVIAEMFGNSVSTSLDYPNLHRKLRARPESYNEIWGRRVREARAAGIDVQVIAVPNQATLEIGAEHSTPISWMSWVSTIFRSIPRSPAVKRPPPRNCQWRKWKNSAAFSSIWRMSGWSAATSGACQVGPRCPAPTIQPRTGDAALHLGRELRQYHRVD
ncbi:MAG: hypothetical protein R3F36_16790 [Candidatus Competibacteraceae bacterium]